MGRHAGVLGAVVPLILLLAACNSDDPGKDPGMEDTDPADTDVTDTDTVDPGDTDTDVPDPPDDPFVRPIVLAEHPLDLENTNGYATLWPVWGGAFAVDGEVALRADMAATGDAGLLLAGPGAAKARGELALLSVGSAWVLRERQANELVAEVPLVTPDTDSGGPELILAIAANGTTVTVTGAAMATHELSAPIGDAGEHVGMYASLEPGARLAVTSLALTAPLPTHPELGTPLRELAQAHGVTIGSATDIWPPLHDLGFESLFAEQFDLASPTELYWPTTRGEDDGFWFVAADLMINYATVHDQEVTGMFLVWDFALPRWVKDLAADDPDALGPVFDEHIETVVSRYAGRVDTWVVVNEAIWGPEETGDPEGMFARTLWWDTLGSGYIDRAFEVARAADPAATLMYNETGAEEVNPKSDFMLEMADDMLGRGVPLDAVGFQFHVRADTPPDMASVQQNFERFAALGLDVFITELDVSLEGVKGTEDERLAMQAAVYQDVLEVCLAVPACRSYTVFGFSDWYAWDELGDATPLVFDEDYLPKPAFFAIQDALTP